MMKRYIHLLWIWAFVMPQCLLAERYNYPVDTIQGQLVYRYTVERSIGLYRISVNFGVKQEDIIQLNPELKERGLRYDEVIYVPVKERISPVDSLADIVTTNRMDSLVLLDTVKTIVPVLSTTSLEDVVSVDTITMMDSIGGIHIGVLLPLHADAVSRDAVSDRFLEFYEGLLVALYSLPSSASIQLHVFDIGRGTDEVERLVNSGRLANLDAIIGPAYPAQVTAVASFAQEDSIPIWIPFTDRVAGLETNPFLYQFNPDVQTEAHVLGEYLESIKDSIHCVFVEADDTDIPYSIREIRQEIRNRRISYSFISAHDLLQDSLYRVLKDSVENLILLNTEKFSNIQVLMPHLLVGKLGYRLTLISQYSWQQEKIILPQLFTSIFVVNEERKAVYEPIYNRFFPHEHVSQLPRYDLLGYDLMRTLWAWIHEEEYSGIQSDIHFEPISLNGGYLNTHVQVIRL